MILSSVTTPLLGLVDTAVVGHLDEPRYLGAVATGSTLFTVLFMGLNFLRMGTTGVTAQAFGAGRGDATRQALGQALARARVLAVAMIARQAWILDLGLAALGPAPEVAALAGEYFRIRIWSAPASLANFVLIGWLLGMQNARGPLVLVLVTNLVNVVLSVSFVTGLGLQVRGVALATLLAELAGLVEAGMAQQGRDLVAGYPRQRSARQLLVHHRRQVHQHLVASVAAEGLVEYMQPVDVQHQHHALVVGERRGQFALEHRPGQQAGEAVIGAVQERPDMRADIARNACQAPR